MEKSVERDKRFLLCKVFVFVVYYKNSKKRFLVATRCPRTFFPSLRILWDTILNLYNVWGGYHLFKTLFLLIFQFYLQMHLKINMS